MSQTAFVALILTMLASLMVGATAVVPAVVAYVRKPTKRVSLTIIQTPTEPSLRYEEML